MNKYHHMEMFKPQGNDDKKKLNQPILMRINKIQDIYLKHIDIELFRFLKLQNVEFKIFLLRWIRCVHTREVSLPNVLRLWDYIFLD